MQYCTFWDILHSTQRLKPIVLCWEWMQFDLIDLWMAFQIHVILDNNFANSNLYRPLVHGKAVYPCCHPIFYIDFVYLQVSTFQWWRIFDQQQSVWLLPIRQLHWFFRSSLDMALFNDFKIYLYWEQIVWELKWTRNHPWVVIIRW